MVAIEHGTDVSGRMTIPRFPVWALIALIALLATFGGFVARGFSPNGLRFGSELGWRFACVAYFAAVIAGPMARLIPWTVFRQICEERRQLVWGFCASFLIYLASILVPNTLTPPTLDRDGLTAGMTLFVLFGAGLTLVIAYASSRHAAAFLGVKAQRCILGTGMSFFWLAYTLTALSRITGPHRPDSFYGFSLSLMVLALLLRFADAFAAKVLASRTA